MNKIYSLPLAVLLLSACSQKQVETKVPHSITKTKKIMAIQPQVTKVQRQIRKRTSPSTKLNSNIISTPILVKNPQHIQAPISPQRVTIAPQQIVPFNRPKMQIEEEPHVEIETPIQTQQYVEEQPIQTQQYVEEQPIQTQQYEEEQPIQTQQYVEEQPVQTQRYVEEQPIQTQRYVEQPYIPPIVATQSFQSANSSDLQGEFSGNYNLTNFINRMVNEHGFDRNYLNQIFSQAQNTNSFVRPYREPSSTYISGAWDRYKQNFIYERNIQRGIKFWNEHRATLNRATAEYGIPAEYIVGIIGIETAYGVNFGKKRVLDVLTTKSMLPNRRADFYTKQLEKFLLMTRKANLEPTELMGSSAGAMGYGQFIPSSYLEFAVDFNGDGKIDLWDAEDAIGSIANYFARNGWNSSIGQVAIRAKYNGNRFKRLKTGYKTKYSQYKLRKKYKIKPRTKMSYRGPVSLLRLNRSSHDELWFGTHNFRVLTTYNHSSHYGMAVFQLGEEVKKRRGGYYSSL